MSKHFDPRILFVCVLFPKPLCNPRGFCVGDKEMEFQKIPIYCPKCGTRVLHWNGITKMQIATTCTGCGKFVLYDPEINKVSVSNFHPERTTSSGKRFY